jgi:hypothetical protein
MTYLQNLAKDLVDRRLWPVAVLLVAALVAVPVVLAKGGSTPSPVAPAATGAAADASAGTAQAVVKVDAGPAPSRRRAGALHNPFVQPTAKAAPKASTPSSSSSSGAASTGGSATASPSTGTPSSSGSGSPGAGGSSSTPSTPATADVYTATLRFGRTDAPSLKTHRDLVRLSPLPSVEDPFVVFLGVLTDHKTAAFLVDATAQPHGEGRCRPSKTNCQTLELHAGDTEILDLTAPDGTSVQYQIELVRVSKVQATEAKAAALYLRKDIGGQEVVRTTSEADGGSSALRAYHFRPADGLVARARHRPGAHIASTGTAPYRWQTGELSVFRTVPKADR